jgi:hypothetical protein
LRLAPQPEGTGPGPSGVRESLRFGSLGLGLLRTGEDVIHVGDIGLGGLGVDLVAVEHR